MSTLTQLRDTLTKLSSGFRTFKTDLELATALAKGAIPQTLLTAAGDLIYASGAGVAARLAASTNGFVLTLVGGLPAWVAATTGLPASGVLGQSVVNTGSGTGAWAFPLPVTPFASRRYVRWYIALAADTAFTSDGVSMTSNAVGAGVAAASVGTISTKPSLFINNNGGASTGNVTYMSREFTRPDFRPRVRFAIRSPASLTSKRFYVGFMEGGYETITPLASGTATGVTATRHAVVAFDANVSANWLLQSGDGTTRGGTDTGLAVVASTDYWIDLDWSVAGTLTLRIYASAITNAPTVTTRTTQLATGSTLMYGTVGDIALAAGVLPGFDRTAFLWESN
jgi:hypothetical protein